MRSKVYLVVEQKPDYAVFYGGTGKAGESVVLKGVFADKQQADQLYSKLVKGSGCGCSGKFSIFEVDPDKEIDVMLAYVWCDRR